MASFRIIHTSIPGRKGPAVGKENQDRVLVRRVRRDGSSLFLVGIADGISRCPCGGRVAEYLMGKHLKRDRMFTHGDHGPAHQLEEYLQRLNTQFYEEFIDHPKMLASGATMSVGLLENDTAHHYWVGDSPILIARRDGAGRGIVIEQADEGIAARTDANAAGSKGVHVGSARGRTRRYSRVVLEGLIAGRATGSAFLPARDSIPLPLVHFR
jgi:hypothetical protein